MFYFCFIHLGFIISSLDWVVVGFVWFCFGLDLMEFKLALNLLWSRGWL